MTPIVYGSTACSNCKSLLSLAKARGVEVTYKLIDQDEEARAEYEACQPANRTLPFLVVHNPSGSQTHAYGLPQAVSVLNHIKESK